MSAIHFKTTLQLGGSPRAEVGHVVDVPGVVRAKARSILAPTVVAQVAPGAVMGAAGRMEDISSSTTSVNPLTQTRSCALVSLLFITSRSSSRRIFIIIIIIVAILVVIMFRSLRERTIQPANFT